MSMMPFAEDARLEVAIWGKPTRIGRCELNSDPEISNLLFLVPVRLIFEECIGQVLQA